jgi:RNA polymerase sigma-70 factor (ECF subfamily)
MYRAPENQISDLQLIELVAEGDSDAFSQLYDRYHIAIFNYLLRLVNRHRTAEDLLQDTFLGVWQGAKRFRKKSSVKTWLFRIGHYKAISWLRAQSRLRVIGEENIDLQPPDRHGTTLEEHTINRWEQQQVQKALEQLSPKHRAVIELTFVHQFSYSEIAKILRCPVGTVKSRMSYALRHLNQEVLKRGFDG